MSVTPKPFQLANPFIAILDALLVGLLWHGGYQGFALGWFAFCVFYCTRKIN